MRSKILYLFSVLGIFAPILLFISITALGILFPGYNILTEYVSILGSRISPFHAIVNIFGFGLFGIIMMGFVLALEDQLPDNHFARIGMRLYLGGGLLIFTLGGFPSDPNILVETFDGKMHTILGRIAFLMIPISMIWFGLAFKKAKNWENLWVAITFALAVIALITASILGFFPTYIYDGSIERIGIGASLLWMFLVSINLFLNHHLNKLIRKE